MDQSSKKNLIFGLVIFLALLLILPIIVWQVQRPQEIRTRAQTKIEDFSPQPSIVALSKKLLEAGNRYQAQVGFEKEQALKELKETVELRRNLILSLIKEDPAKANEVALSEGELTLLPKGIQALLEKRIEIEGTLEVLHEDDFEGGKSKNQFFLEAQDKKRYNLHLPPVSKPLVSGTKVSIKGIALEENIAAAPEDDGGMTVLSEPQVLQVPVTKNTVVIMVNFQDYQTQPWTVATVNDVIFNQTANYYSENSFRKLAITGDIFGYYTLPINRSCDFYTILGEAIKASDADIFFPNYQTIIIAGPLSCRGAANVGNVSTFTQDGTVSVGRAWLGEMSKFVGGHELGHTYSAWHANFYNCGTNAFAQSGCTSQEYDDLFDIMDRRTVHMNSYHKEVIGFFDQSNIVDVTSSGSYTISPIESATTNPQILKIPIGSSRFLYIDYKQPLGIDSFLSGSILDGAMIRIAPWFLSGSGGGGDTQLLDMTPTSPRSHDDVTLEVRQSFTYDGVATITTANQTPSALTVDITMLPPIVDVKASGSDGPLTLTAPATYFVSWTSTSSSCTKSESWSGSGGSFGSQSFVDVLVAGIYTYTVTCTNVGGSISDSVTVNILEPTTPPVVDLKVNEVDGSLTLSEPASVFVNWKAQYATSGCTNSGDWTGSAYSSYSASFPSLLLGTYTYTVTCSNPLGTTSDTATVNVVAPDTTPPTVAITSPLNGATVSKNTTITITASATDNVGVTKVEFLVNGNLKCTDTTSPYSCSWKVPAAKNKTYTLSAKAYDAAGNIGSSSNVRVTAR